MAGRLERVRAAMRAKGVDALVVRGTDAYLSEYVPEAESGRVWLTGFTGSLGDALVSHDQAWLFVDGNREGVVAHPDGGRVHHRRRTTQRVGRRARFERSSSR